MTITTAIIFAAGFGSRMLPVTSAVEKELLPILDRPIIDYVVGDLIAAGIKRIVFVIRPGSHSLQDYYLGNIPLTSHLKRHHKAGALAQLNAIHRQANFTFIEQPASAGYGTAVPLMMAAPSIPSGEAFIVCDGDAFSWHPGKASETTALMRTFTSTEAVGALSALEMPTDQLHRYGVLKVQSLTTGDYLSDFIEKPAPGQAPSNLVNISKYILTPTVIPYVERVKPNPNGERYLTDALLAAAHDHPIAVHRAQGEFLDAGNVASWLHANLTVARARPDLHETLYNIATLL